jgi:NAD(P)-dependent dehydrogenase (short-subunit alcohol dehydrogenase family)/acyl carrier protein
MVEATLLEVVSQLTGYPGEMLGMDMDIESELGIDSIKRVEILSTLEEKMPDLPTVSPDIMGSLKTLGQIAEFIGSGQHAKSSAPRPESAADDHDPATFPDSFEAIDNRQIDLADTLLEVVSRLTGYPPEMLGLDMDIEAELGIDSIKRVEILSTLEEKMPDLPAVSPDMMGTLKTLRQIADYLTKPESGDTSSESNDNLQSGVFQAVADENPANSSASEPAEFEPDRVSIPRNTVSITEAPPVAETTIPISETKKVFVTEDHTGLSEEITEALANLNIKTVRVSLDILKYKDQLPDAAGLIIVQDPRSDQMDQDLKDAFALAKYLAPALMDSARSDGAIFATVTRLDGTFGFGSGPMRHPVQGGLAGLAKTAALEWENVCCHAIDVTPDWSDNRAIAAAVVREVMSPGPIEIGLDPDFRRTLSLVTEPRPVGSINLGPDDIVIISGGARGVTAAAAHELAGATGVRLVLLGRSPAPVAEPDWLSVLENEGDIKKALLENEFRETSATPVEVDNAYKRHMANREIAVNIKELKSTGANVDYYATDVRNPDAVRAIIDEIRHNHGPISGIIHGAGVLEDRLIVDKTPEQFERVYDTKVSGLNNLLDSTRQDPLKYLVLFSSIAARLGNKGQVDYAMANEVLNKIAQSESVRRVDCRVISINWGPWDGGMVTSSLKREFERHGINLIPVEFGAKSMLYEMMSESNSPVEIVIGAELNKAVPNNRSLPKRPELVKPAPAIKNGQLALAFEREVDARRYPILQDHIIDGKHVVPLALMTEWFAHGALHENPGLVLQGLDDIRVMKGIRLEQDTKLIRLLAGKPQKNGKHYEVPLELRDGKMMGKDILHAKARAILSDDLAPAPAYQFSKTMVAKAYSKKVAEVYDEILFHGQQLHGIRKIISCSSRGMVAHISTAPAPSEWMTVPLRNQWIADPLVLDCAFQMATVWCFEEQGVVSLPSYGASYRQYCAQFPADGVTAVLEIEEAANRRMRGNFTFLDSAEAIVARLNGYEAIMDASLFKAFKPQYRASA